MPPHTLKIIFCFKSANSDWISSDCTQPSSNLCAIFWTATCHLLCADGRVDLTFLRCLPQAGCVRQESSDRHSFKGMTVGGLVPYFWLPSNHTHLFGNKPSSICVLRGDRAPFPTTGAGSCQVTLFSPPLADTVWTHDLGGDLWMLKIRTLEGTTQMWLVAVMVTVVLTSRLQSGGAGTDANGLPWLFLRSDQHGLPLPSLPISKPSSAIFLSLLWVTQYVANELFCLWSVPKNLAFPFHLFE